MDVEKNAPSLSASAATNAEESRLAELGYTQELKRGFSLPGIVAFSFSIVTSWTALSGVLIVGVQSGGPSVMIWSWVGVCILTLSVAYSLAEMCSAYPVAGGQYSWVAVFAPMRLRRGMSYLCGWFLNIGILAMGATSHTVSANFLLGLANLNNRDFEIKSWHNPLVAWAVALSSLIINIWGSKLLNKGSQLFLALNISSFLIVVVTILVMNGDKRSTDFVFSDFVNLTGWPPAYTALLGILQASYGMCCYDSASRMTEEIKDSRRQAPRAIVMSVYIGFVTGFVFLIAASFSMSSDLDAIAGTSTGVPIMEIFYHATSTVAGATGIASLITIVGVGASFGLTATAGRSIYAFARDSGLPCSRILSRVDSKNSSPTNALCCAVAVQMCLIAIQFGTATGFSTVIAIATEGFYVSYAFPLVARLLSLFTSQPARHIGGLYSLGQWSIPLNIVAVAYLLFTTITFNLPTVHPVTSDNMNYTSAAVGAVMSTALLTWVTTGRKHFRGPESGGVAVAIEASVVHDGGGAFNVDHVNPEKMVG